MAYEVIILGHLHMPLYFLGTFTEYPYANGQVKECDELIDSPHSFCRKFRAIIMCTKFIINMDAL